MRVGRVTGFPTQILQDNLFLLLNRTDSDVYLHLDVHICALEHQINMYRFT